MERQDLEGDVPAQRFLHRLVDHAHAAAAHLAQNAVFPQLARLGTVLGRLRAERKIRLQEALNTLEPMDREVLALRHFEQLTTPEVAQVLGIKEAAASKRYIRAWKKLQEFLTSLPDGREGR